MKKTIIILFLLVFCAPIQSGDITPEKGSSCGWSCLIKQYVTQGYATKTPDCSLNCVMEQYAKSLFKRNNSTKDDEPCSKSCQRQCLSRCPVITTIMTTSFLVGYSFSMYYKHNYLAQ